MPTKVLTDTTIHSAAEVLILLLNLCCVWLYSKVWFPFKAEEQGLTTGIKFPGGRGKRCLLLGAGGLDGWGKTISSFLWTFFYLHIHIALFHHCSTEFDKSVETQSKNQGWKEKRSCFWRLPWWYTVKYFISLDIFFTTNSLDFDSAAFETWLKDLLEELKARYGEKVVIVLDNAPYHGRQVSVHMLSYTTI